ncbi:hypothetical protein WICPIJ_004961 [Wickerhamomyces pijperi]|uniref:Reticulon-like protein n=1 Tax=Wickerhamomyces pijperi TaxID=599730 RepID=A0A9P8Q738_WICPI|nr:hypothetical protein WICPIJ_004961 [Wickerhamomyces pijperi]
MSGFRHLFHARSKKFQKSELEKRREGGHFSKAAQHDTSYTKFYSIVFNSPIHHIMSTSSTAPKSIGQPLLTWKNPVATGKVFGGIIASLIVIKYVDLLNLFFRLTSIALLTSAAAEYVGKKATGTGFVTKFRPAYTTSFSTTASQSLTSLTKSLPCLEKEGQQLLYSFNIEKTLKSAGLFYILYKITSIFSLYTLAVLTTIGAFTLPFIYETYQTEINEVVSQGYKIGKDKAEEYTKIAYEKAEPVLKQVDEKLGPVSKFVKQQYKVRTASTTVAEDESKSTTSAAAFTSGASTSSTSETTYNKTEPIVTKVAPTVSDIKADFPEVPKTNPFIEKVEAAAEKVAESPVVTEQGIAN